MHLHKLLHSALPAHTQTGTGKWACATAQLHHEGTIARVAIKHFFCQGDPLGTLHHHTIRQLFLAWRPVALQDVALRILAQDGSLTSGDG